MFLAIVNTVEDLYACYTVWGPSVRTGKRRKSAARSTANCEYFTDIFHDNHTFGTLSVRTYCPSFIEALHCSSVHCEGLFDMCRDLFLVKQLVSVLP